MAVDSEVVRTHKVVYAEEQYHAPTGKVYFFRYVKAPLRGPDGGVTGLVVISRDVTEQKEFEKALEESKANQAFLLQLTDALRDPLDIRELVTRASTLLGTHLAVDSVAYSDVDPTGDYVEVIQDWIGTNFSTVIGTFRLDDYGLPIAVELRAGRTVKVEDTQNDRLIPGLLQQEAFTALNIRGIVSVPMIRNGRMTSILSVIDKSPRIWTNIEVSLIEEVTARVWASVEKARAETALRESEARFRAAVQANSSIMWINNARGEVEMEMPAWGAFTGQQREDYHGNGWSKAIHPEDAQKSIDAYKEALSSRQIFAIEHRIRRHDDTWRVCSSQAVPVFDKNDNLVEWVGVTNDITE